MKTKRSVKGFTLIEIVITLAIAGLIFVIIFLAVGQAQASRRDTQRRSDASRFIAGALQFASNNRGLVPSSQAQTDDVRINYIDNPVDPSAGTPYNIVFRFGDPDPPEVGNMTYFTGVDCLDNHMEAGVAGFSIAVVVWLERGGTYCLTGQ